MMMEATTGEPQKLGGMATATEKPQRKLELIREVMQNEWQADAVLFRINNAFDNSDSSDIEAISGFSGSNGTAIVSKTEALLAVDGRYTAQAAQQVNSSVWEVVRYPDYNIIKMIKKIVKPGEELVISASAHSYNSYISILKQAESMDVRVKVIDQYPIDRVLQENSLVIDENYTGDSVNSLCEKQLEKEGVLITDKETVSCLFGIRKKELGADKGPVPRAIAFIPNGESPIVFCDLKAEFDNYKVASIKDFAKEMGKFSGYRVKIDYATCPASFVNTVLELDCKVINCASDYDKIKTSAEMEDQKLGAHKTGESFIRMLAHVDHIVETGAQLTELEAVSFFKNADAIDYSFIPICASGKNTSIVHHQASADIIRGDALFLFDAGFHFKNSTTDVTRVIYIGNRPSPLYQKVYTTILKAIIHYSTARFPSGTKGSCLDSICRYCMWQNSMDYYFGTGHGVGNYRSVHQRPAISGGSNDKITGNMVTTIEPGYYTDDFGIRLENMLASVEEQDGYVVFETITHIPFCYKLIDFEMLEPKEIAWLDNYNKRVLDEYWQLFGADKIAIDWLKENTRKIRQ